MDDLFYVPCQKAGCTGHNEIAMSNGGPAYVHCDVCGLRFSLSAQESASIRSGVAGFGEILAGHTARHVPE